MIPAKPAPDLVQGRQLSLARLGIACGFLLIAAALSSGVLGNSGNHWLLVISVLAAGYLALNIGANDAANHIGAAVGSGTIPLDAALALASLDVLAGAYLTGDAVSARLRGARHSTRRCRSRANCARTTTRPRSS